jgi:hypothetical protein
MKKSCKQAIFTRQITPPPKAVIYLPLMKKLILLITLLFISTGCFCTEMKYGALNVFSKFTGSKIYIDGEMKGIESVQIKELLAGTHFIKVTNPSMTPEATIIAEIIEVKAGELSSVYVTETGAQGINTDKSANSETTDVFRVKKVLDYSKEMHTGWYLKLLYVTNLYYNRDNPTYDYYGSNLGAGLGFKIALAPNIDFTLEMARADLNSHSSRWYFMPITANIQLSYLPSPYFRGKQYYGLGIGYYMTDVETSLDQNLTAMGYHLFYGIEMPAGDNTAYFFEFGYHNADLSRYNYGFSSAYASAGYRFDVTE